MLNDLKFVQGAVGKKDLIPEMTHFKIQGGRINSFNGNLALSTPIKLDLDCAPKAVPFIKDVQNCTDTVSLSMTPAGRLGIKSGSFKAFIECVESTSPHVEPGGEMFDINGEGLMTALKTLAPFIGDDATRPWSNGVLLKGQSAYATNNVILVEYWVGTSFPVTCCIPRSAVKEMLRIGEPPIRAQSTANSLTLHYEGDRYLITNLLSIGWPDAIDSILATPSTATEIDLAAFFTGLDSIKPFSDDLTRVYFNGGVMRTSPDENLGASYELTGIPEQGIFSIEKMLMVASVAQTIGLDGYPGPCMFYGDNLRGAIIGMR